MSRQYLSNRQRNLKIGVSSYTENDQVLDVVGNISISGIVSTSEIISDKISVSGVSTFTSDLDINASIDVDGHTELDDVNVSGVITATSFIGDGSNLTNIPIEVSNDTTPQLGGDLDLNSNNITGTGNIDINGNLNVSGVSTFQSNIHLLDSVELRLGAGNDLKIYHNGNNSFVSNVGTGDLNISGDDVIIRSSAFENKAKFITDGAVELYYDNSKKFETTGIGVSIYDDLNVGTGVTIYGNSGIVSATSFYGDGSNLTGISADQVGALADIVEDTTPQLGGDLDVNGNDITGTGNINLTGVITATAFVGDGQGITGLTASQVGALDGVIIQEEGSTVGSVENINFVSDNLTATASGAGATITLTETPEFDNLTVTGVSTLGNTTIGLGNTEFIVDGDARITGVITANRVYSELYGEFTGNSVVSDSIVGTSLSISGISTLGTVQISSGIVTATSGVVTYYGDGSKLSDLTASQVGALASLVDDPNPQLGGDLDVNGNDIIGTGNVNLTGVITATSFVGDGTGITGLTASQVGALDGVTIQEEGSTVGSVENINFVSDNLTATASGAGATITLTDTPTFTTVTGNLTGTATTATALETARNFSVTGDFVTASAVSFDGTGAVALAATITADSITLGTYTSGDYVESVSGTANEIQVTGGTGEGSTPTIGFVANPTIGGNVTVGQDLTVTRDLQVTRNLNVDGTVTIGGTSATIFAETLKISDPDIILGIRTDANGNDISNDTTANHGGVALASTEGSPLVTLVNPGAGETLPATYKKIMWFKSGSFTGLNTDAWLSNYAFGVGTTSMSAGTKFAVGNIEADFDDITAVRNINSTGVITATSFVGDGTGITGLTANQVGAIADIVSDTTPQLGGDLDVNSNDITGTGNVNLTGIITATSFVGDGTGITGLTASQVGALAGVSIREEGIVVGTTGSVGDINFVSDNLTATASGAGATITLTETPEFDNLTITGVSTFSGDANFDNGLLYVDSVNNRIGIGTTNPSSLLNVKGIIKFEAPTLDNRTLTIVAGSNGTISQQSGNLTIDGGGAVAGQIKLGNNSTTFIKSTNGYPIEIYYGQNDKRLATTDNGIAVSGIVTAISGIVTYYGDGSKLSGLTASQVNALAGVTIQEEGSTVGTAGSVGIINFVSDNLTATASGAGATITLTETPEFDNLTVTGVSTFQNNANFDNGTLYVDSVNNRIGIGTTNPQYKLEVRGDGDFQNLYIGKDYVFNGSPLQITNLGQDIIRPNGRLLLRSGATSATAPTINLTNNAGVSIYGGSSSNGVTISGGAESGASGGDVTITNGNLIVTGISSITNLNVTGVSTLGTVKISSGIVTAVSGIVTYYGDGSNLTGVGGTVAISTTAPSAPDVGDLWYSPDYARTLIYYDDGSSQQWVDASPFNVGILTVTNFTASNLNVTSALNVSGVSTFSDIDVRSFNATFGTSTGSQIELNGNNGSLNKQNGSLKLYGGGTSGSEVGILNNSNIYLKPNTGGVDLYYGKTDKKFETTGYGVTVSGDLNVSGNASVVGILTVGSSSITIDGSSDELKVGTGVTINAGGLNVTGVTTSTSFVKSGGTSLQFLKADGSVDSSTYITSADGGNADQLDGQEGTYYLDYNNFTNTPTIPTNNNQLTNGAGYITSADGGNAATLDSLDSTQFLRSDASDTASGAITLSVDTADALNFSASSTNDARGISFNNRTALSADHNDGWLRLNQSSEFSNGVYTPGNFRADGSIYVDNGTNYLSYPTGQYGSVQINGDGAGGYEGFSIDGRVVFMHNGSTASGIYNDVNNHWMFYGVLGGSAYMYDNGTWKIRTTSSGIQVSGDVNSTSDIKLKKNIKTIDNALDKVLRLRGVYFDWKEEVMGTDKNIGLIAQEVEKVVPELVTETERENSDNIDTDEEVIGTETIKSVSYGNITAVLIEAVKEQQKQIDTLTKRIEELGG